jgi:hypothetical protein
VNIFAYNSSAAGSFRIRPSAANDDLCSDEGVDFLELSDATAGVDFGLSHCLTSITAVGLCANRIQGFKAMILSASADIVDDNTLENILYGSGGNDTFLTRAQQEVVEWNATQNAQAFRQYA